MGDDLKAAWKAAPPFPIATSPRWKLACSLAMQEPNPKAAALVYCRYGVPVIPCNPVEPDKDKENSKRPYVSIYEGSIDPAQIEQWWMKYPDALIGGVMGRRSGVFVLDVDSLEGHGVDGIKNWQLLELEFQTAVHTRRHWSASKGLHLLFRWDERRPIGTSLGNLPKGMEVKGEGGQIILPGSVLRNGLRWTVSSDNNPSPAPDWLFDILSPHSAAPSRPPTGNGTWRPDYASARLEQSEAGLRDAGDSERNAAAGRFAMPIGHLAGGGAFEGALTVDQVRNRLIEAARANLGWSAKFISDVGRAFDNGLKEPARPRGKASKPPPERTITLSMAEVEMKPIEWLWPDRVAIGKLTMLAGHPANGKSLVTLDMAARISTGREWPLNGSRAPLGNVILLSAEDDPADTYGPRLKAMGADLARIFAISARPPLVAKRRGSFPR
jgi:Bifunctional DNA primase/polymerase, N-terminal/AAA domain